MRAARTVSKETIEYVDLPTPVPNPGEAVIRIEHVTLCGTDLHIWEDDYTTELPIIQGHELAGTVVDVAQGVTRVKVGDRVAIDPLRACGECAACRRGKSNVCPDLVVLGCYCDGGLAEEIAWEAERLHVLPKSMPTDIAPLAEPFAIALQAVRRGRAAAGDTVLVLGAGPIGLLASLALSDLGATVIAADTLPDRLALARRFGAQETILVDPAVEFPGPDGAAIIERLTGGEGPDLVIEATGVPISLANAVRTVAAGGRITQVGIAKRDVTFPMHLLPFKEIDIVGSRNSEGLIPECLEIIARHPETVRSLITHRFDFDDLDAAYRTMGDRSIPVGKIAIDIPIAADSDPGVTQAVGALA